MNQITFKKATVEDWEIIRDIEKVAASKLFFSLESKKDIVDYIEKSTVFILMAENHPIGTIAYQVESEYAAELEGLVIIPSHRGKGMATLAIKKIMEDLGNIKFSLTVHPSNSTAIKLYLNLGFIIKGWKDNYFNDGEPRLIMEKPMEVACQLPDPPSTD